MKSIRGYLLSRLFAGVAVGVFVTGVAGYVVVTRALEEQLDANLRDRVRSFASILFQVEDEVEAEFSEELMPEYEKGERQAYFELSYAEGPLLERSPSLYFAKTRLSGERVIEWSKGPAHWNAKMPDGRKGRFVAEEIEVHHIHPEEGPGRPTPRRVRVVIALGLEELAAARSRVLWICVGAFGSLFALIAGIVWFAVRRALEPTDRLGAAVDAIAVEDLPERFDVGELPRELAPMADKTDALIRRVESALERERRTTADIAHELRTPISELLTVSEVALRSPEDSSGMQRALATARDTAGRMGRSVSTLLKLAWLEMGAGEFERSSVDLGLLVREIVRSLSAPGREREIDVDVRVEPGEVVTGDGEAIRIVVSNLLANAVRYAPGGSTVVCRTLDRDDRWSVVVENAAPELEGQDLSSLSEPFWRKERSRSDRKRFGLGLALSRALVERAGMRLEFQLIEGVLSATLSGEQFREPLRARA